jgi:hypothetical protein
MRPTRPRRPTEEAQESGDPSGDLLASAHIPDYFDQFVAIDQGLGGRIARGTGEKAGVHVVFGVSQIEIGGSGSDRLNVDLELSA